MSWVLEEVWGDAGDIVVDLMCAVSIVFVSWGFVCGCGGGLVLAFLGGSMPLP